MAEEAADAGAVPEKKEEAGDEVVGEVANGEGVGESKEESGGEKGGDGSSSRPPIDVSKPMERPDRGEFEAATSAMNEEVSDIKAKIDEIEVKINEAKNSGSDQSTELKEAKEALKALRERREQLNKERSDIFGQQESAKASLKSKVQQTKSLRAELKYETPEKYDERILELEKKQSTTSMSLRDEKALLKEIEQLKSSKKLVSALAATNSEIQADKQSAQSIGDALKAKIGELDEVRKQFEKQKKVVDSLNEANQSRRAVLPALYKEKEALRKEKTAKLDEIRAFRAEFKQKENDYREYKKEIVRLRNEERKREEEARLAAIEEKKRKAEEEELKRIPYKEEIELCDYLAHFLQTNYLSGEAASSSSSNQRAANDESSPATEKPSAGGALEFEGMVLAGKAAIKDEEDYLSLNTQFGKKKGRGKKRGGQKVAERISLVPETIEIFGVLNLEPPATLSAVSLAIQQLKDKKAWFQEQPRGAIPSIRDKQRAEEAKAQQGRRESLENRRAGREGDRPPRGAAPPAPPDGAATEAKDNKKPTKKKDKDAGFNAADAADEAFPSLPGAPKPSKEPSPVEESKAEAAEAPIEDDADDDAAAPVADDEPNAEAAQDDDGAADDLAGDDDADDKVAAAADDQADDEA